MQVMYILQLNQRSFKHIELYYAVWCWNDGQLVKGAPCHVFVPSQFVDTAAALYSLYCAEVPLRNCSLTHSAAADGHGIQEVVNPVALCPELVQQVDHFCHLVRRKTLSWCFHMLSVTSYPHVVVHRCHMPLWCSCLRCLWLVWVHCRTSPSLRLQWLVMNYLTPLLVLEMVMWSCTAAAQQ